MESYQQLAKILRTDQDIIKGIDAKSGVLDAMMKENQVLIHKSLKSLEIDRDSTLKEIISGLSLKLESDENKIKTLFSGVRLTESRDCKKVLDYADQFLNPKEGFFMKKGKAVEFLRRHPPENILKFLGYKNIDEALEKEDVLELFATLRFGEEKDWLHDVFFKQYEALTPGDFEKRKISHFAFPAKFAPLAQEFIKKKYHNLSHLKELGVIFVVPFAAENLNLSLVPGQLMKVFSLAFHYFHEVMFYSDVFESLLAKPDFSKNLISLLRGDVSEPKINLDSKTWLVTQRYLEKDDPFELGLLAPHINPESMHWAKAQNDISKINSEFEFWSGLDWVGDYFKDEVNNDVLVSFNLVDIAMSLADKEKQVIYTYHQREAMWNKLFASFFGWEILENSAKENIISGKIGFQK
ncbi:MAG: hypothetical protein A2418_00075 [Candidatus Brennerbacteria bacterium RIFOXYC1_FULL_41_11]|uniref:Uncharacterized protein n=1 Tax=Candidatus Brennerbacteria bacterium RIFOXYD1_FULL_41_16 TaxID=1797529 RepID=A0A1G1XJ61_9BACT|nr:MAG: hypothetical protein A2418_00075 [Candidatus Brennerbacteria bacterium RIFOXYC1_FULL_41_11]OGY40155.1 MAG: hypothetical protein A2570_02610 [Candidatus Brennerbacteria bacterium RIFOXYD1_FULL_41_16]